MGWLRTEGRKRILGRNRGKERLVIIRPGGNPSKQQLCPIRRLPLLAKAFVVVFQFIFDKQKQEI